MFNVGSARQWCTSFTAALCMAIAASEFNWLTPLAVQFTSKDSPIPMTELQRSWVSACASIGNTLSCIPIGIAANIWGRKPILLLAGPVALFGWFLMIVTRSLPVLYLVGLMHGYTMATAFCICSIYIAEIAGAKIRGALCSQINTLFYLGAIYVNVAAYFVNYTYYLYILALLPLVYTIVFSFMPETPHYLLKSGKDQRAVKVLHWLTLQNNVVISERFVEMKASLKKEFSWKDFLFKRRHRRALIIVSAAYILKCFGGQISLQIYITQIFSSVTNTVEYSIFLTIILNIILCIACFVSGFISDMLGRRPIMYVTSFASGIFHLIIAIYFFAYDSNVQFFSGTNIWIIFSSMVLALTLGNMSMSVFLPTLTAEYFVTEARPLGSSIAHAIGGLTTFISIIAYQLIKDNIGDYFNFFIFAFCSFGASGLIYFYVRETARKTLERIQKEIELT